MLFNPNVWVILLQDGSSDCKHQVSIQSTPLNEGDSHSARSEFSTCCFFNNPLLDPNKQSGSYVTQGMTVGIEGMGNT